MRAMLSLLSLALVMYVSSPLAQNTPPAGAKPAEAKAAEQPSSPAPENKKTADAAKPRDEKKPAEAKPAPGKTAEAKATATKPGDAPAADSAPQAAGDKDLRKSAKTDGPPCVVAEFRALGIDVHDPAKRRTQAITWLKKRAKNCSVDQLLMIRNNRSQWMGTADSAALAGEVDALLEVFAADNPQVAALLYGTVQPPSEEGK